MEKKLIIVSYGLKPLDISLEAIQKINSTDLLINQSCYHIKQLKDYIKVKIFELPKSVTDLKDDYEKIDLIYNKYIKKFFKTKTKISILTHGNPLFFNIYSTEILEKTKNTNIKTEVYPATSSIDYVIHIIKLKINPLLENFMLLSFPSQLEIIKNKIKRPDIIILNFHVLKNKKISGTFLKENFSKKFELYSIKFDMLKLKYDIKKYNSPKSIKKMINEIDEKTTVYLKTH